MKRIIYRLLIMALALLTAAVPTALAVGAEGGALYTDMPAEQWAIEAVTAAYDYGLMRGRGDGAFGTGETISRAEFVTVLARMMGWDTPDGDDRFDDVSGHWARDSVNAAAANGAVEPGGLFRPDDAITRREMAVTLVNALGLGQVAESAEGWELPFTDVTEDRGYIAVARDIGMTNGTSATTFSPEDTARREEAAAMLTRVYERFTADTDFTHAFYAISSYSQLELAKSFDAVTLMWSHMTYSGGTAALSTDTADGGYGVPEGYGSVVTELRGAGVELCLGVYMDTAGGLAAMLEDDSATRSAVDDIVAEATAVPGEVGYCPYSGVTVDFEGLRSDRREDFTAFLRELAERLGDEGLTLYVTVPPVTEDGVYYDGYDYRAIGDLADRVILMAHDYAATDMTGFLGSTYYRTAALTPLTSVYYSLRAVCDGETGVRDRTKVTLAISLTAMAWETDEDGLLISAAPTRPGTDTVYRRLTEGAEMGWSDTYKNPWCRYTTETGQHIFLWYEDARSVAVKTGLAKLFGVTGVSLWRLGQVPDYADDGIYYNVMDAL